MNIAGITRVPTIFQKSCVTSNIRNLNNMAQNSLPAGMPIPYLSLALVVSSVAAAVFFILSKLFDKRVDQRLDTQSDRDPFKGIFGPDSHSLRVEGALQLDEQTNKEIENLEKEENPIEKIDGTKEIVNRLLSDRKLHAAYFVVEKYLEKLFDKEFNNLLESDQLAIVEKLKYFPKTPILNQHIECSLHTGSLTERVSLRLFTFIQKDPKSYELALRMDIEPEEYARYGLHVLAKLLTVSRELQRSKSDNPVTEEYKRLPEKMKEALLCWFKEKADELSHQKYLKLLDASEIKEKESFYLYLLSCESFDKFEAATILEGKISKEAISKNFNIVDDYLCRVRDSEPLLKRMEKVRGKDSIECVRCIVLLEGGKFAEAIDKINALPEEIPLLKKLIPFIPREDSDKEIVVNHLTNEKMLGYLLLDMLNQGDFGRFIDLLEKVQDQTVKEDFIKYVLLTLRHYQNNSSLRNFVLEYITHEEIRASKLYLEQIYKRFEQSYDFLIDLYKKIQRMPHSTRFDLKLVESSLKYKYKDNFISFTSEFLKGEPKYKKCINTIEGVYNGLNNDSMTQDQTDLKNFLFREIAKEDENLSEYYELSRKLGLKFSLRY